ncbi:MAG: alpha/beta hydrolase [Chloroflexota bacterium]|nr:alpha/beta hydrolase [Chloroflexota bacterium]
MYEPNQSVPLVMLHGLFGGPENWEGVIPSLPQTGQPMALRLPFFDEGAGLNNVSAVTNYVQECLDEIGFDRMVLMGNSLGGHVAALLALRMPEQVCGLVLTGSGGLFERGFTKVPGSRPRREWIRSKVSEVFHGQFHATEAMVDRVVNVISDRRKARILIQLAKSAKRDKITDRLKLITCPTLLIWGRQDQITQREVAEEFHSNISTSDLIWLDECGHAPMMEHPIEFAYQVNQWWTRPPCPGR